MKKKIRMICTLKSGAVVEDVCKIDKKNMLVLRAIDEMRKAIEESLGCKEPACSNITFGKLTVAVSEIAAIKFKEY